VLDIVKKGAVLSVESMGILEVKHESAATIPLNAESDV
jgi:hypothetical protein